MVPDLPAPSSQSIDTSPLLNNIDDQQQNAPLHSGPDQHLSTTLNNTTASGQSAAEHASFNIEIALKRYNKFKAVHRTATFWALFRQVNATLYSCTICAPASTASDRIDKKDEKGLIKYTSSHGTTSLRRHVREHHPNELEAISKRIEEENVASTRRKSKKRKTFGTRSEVFQTHKKYDFENETQQRHNHELVLLIAKATLPMNIVDNQYFKRYVHGINPRIKIPDRRTLTSKLIPEFKKYCFDKFVTPKLSSMESITITFDLWMSRGCQDIFDVIAHGMDKQFNQHNVHLRMIQCNSTSGIILGQVLKAELENHGLLDKVIACVKDGVSNLKTCTKSLSEITFCSAIDLESCFVGPCFAHLLSGACNKALSPTLDEELSLIDSKAARATLQRCITWTKKSGLGRDAWYASCREKQKTERIMPTPVKTRFVSTVVMMSMMLNYRDVVEHCFSNQESMDLRQRVPSTSTWEIVRVIVETMEPVMKTCFISQTEKGWLLSDAVAKFSALFLKYREMSQPTGTAENNLNEFETQLRSYQSRMATVISAVLRDTIRPLLEFTHLKGRYVQHFLSLALDPEYKSLKRPFMRLHLSNPNAGREIVGRYDCDVIIPLLRRLYEKHNGVTIPVANPGSELPPQTGNISNQQVATNDNVDEVAGIEQDIDCFVVENDETESERIHRKLIAELSDFRKEPFDSKLQDKREWLVRVREKFPHVVSLAQHILGIPPTQIENERVFSLAGRVASPIRSNISTEVIDNLISVACNYPNNGKWAEADVISVRNMEEFSDNLVSNEGKEENNTGSESIKNC